MAEAGYGYLLDWCMDDQPIWFSTRNGGKILSVPYPQELNDIPSIVGRKDSGEQFAQMIVDNFEEMLEQSTKQSLVMGIALHPYLVGQPHRLRPRGVRCKPSSRSAATSGSPRLEVSPIIVGHSRKESSSHDTALSRGRLTTHSLAYRFGDFNWTDIDTLISKCTTVRWANGRYRREERAHFRYRSRSAHCGT